MLQITLIQPVMANCWPVVAARPCSAARAKDQATAETAMAAISMA